MGIYDKLTVESILSPESAEIARKVGSDKILPVDMSAIKAPQLHDLLDFWNKARDGMPLPCASCFDPISIPQHLSHILFIQVDHDPLRFTFRVIGEKPNEAFGKNVAGEEVSKIVAFDLPVGKFMHEAYAWVIAQGCAVAFKGPNGALVDGYRSQEMIYLPFSDGSAKITRILGAAVYYRD
ncbi:MAG: hypothetical protein COA62_10720 [Rhodobiaceae bacterium]|nr:MAG: hypothetical protein COA62_10720 [Rhodobiaceae bacterium]